MTFFPTDQILNEKSDKINRFLIHMLISVKPHVAILALSCHFLLFNFKNGEFPPNRSLALSGNYVNVPPFFVIVRYRNYRVRQLVVAAFA